MYLVDIQGVHLVTFTWTFKKGKFKINNERIMSSILECQKDIYIFK